MKFFIAETRDDVLAIASQHWGGTGHTRSTTFYRLPNGRWAVTGELPKDMLAEYASEIVEKLPEGAEPLQVTCGWPEVDYTYEGDWIPLPGNDFSGCRGNYTFSGCAEGTVEPVNLILRLIVNDASRGGGGGDYTFQLRPRQGWRVTSEKYTITVRNGSRVEECILKKGDVFTDNPYCEATIFELQVAEDSEIPTGGGIVDSLGRW